MNNVSFALYWTSLRNVGWHKFYLSMENSLCDDYITEKFFTILQEYDTVNLIQVQSLPVHNWPYFGRSYAGASEKLCSAILCKLLSHPATSWLQAITYARESCAIHLHNSSRFVDEAISLGVWVWWWWVWTKCAPSVPPTTAACSSVTNRGKTNLVASLTSRKLLRRAWLGNIPL